MPRLAAWDWFSIHNAGALLMSAAPTMRAVSMIDSVAMRQNVGMAMTGASCVTQPHIRHVLIVVPAGHTAIIWNIRYHAGMVAVIIQVI